MSSASRSSGAVCAADRDRSALGGFAMEQLHIQRITAEVANRHRVILRPDDPAMVLVTINEAVLEECFDRLEKRARLLVAELDACFEDMQQRTVAHLTDQVRASGEA